jgi:hypothetical protein
VVLDPGATAMEMVVSGMEMPRVVHEGVNLGLSGTAMEMVVLSMRGAVMEMAIFRMEL